MRRLLLFLLLAPFAHSACLTMSPAGSGAANGSDWNNTLAYTGTWVRGNVYFLADGNYGHSLNLSTAQSGTTTIELRKAQSYDHCTDTGWNTGTMGSSQALWNAPAALGNSWVIIGSGYWIINGNGQNAGTIEVGCGGVQNNPPPLMTGPAPNPAACGIKLDNSTCTSTANNGCDGGNGVMHGAGQNITWESVEWKGQGLNSNNNNNSETYFWFASGGNLANVNISHSYLHNASTTYFTVVSGGWNGGSYDHNYGWGIFDGSLNHGEAIQLQGSNGTVNRNVIHHNIFRDQQTNGDVVAVITGTQTYDFYDNLDFCSTGGTGTTCRHNDGVIGCFNSQTCSAVNIYNNTFSFPSSCGWNVTGGPSTMTVKNNLFFACGSVGMAGGTNTVDYNSYLNSSQAAVGAHDVSASAVANPFVSIGTGNANLTAESNNYNSRTTLGAPFDTLDLYGHSFTTDRGAAQFNPSGPSTYYVSPAGNDANAGTLASPWLTPGHASSVAIAGDTVNFLDGTYTLPAGPAGGGDWQLNTGGTSGHPITFKSVNKWGAKLVGTGSNLNSTAVVGMNSSYNIVQDFDITGSDSNGINMTTNATSASFNVAQGNYVHDMTTPCTSASGAGITTSGGGNNYAGITNETIIGNFVINILDTGGTCHASGGIDMFLPFGTVANNIVINSGTDIETWHAASNETIFGNTTIGGFIGITLGAGDSPGSITNDNSLVQNNIIINASAVGLQEHGTTGLNNIFTNNNVFGNAINVQLLHSHTDPNLVTGNPLFVNNTGTVAGNYRIQAASPAKGTGLFLVGILTDYAGNPRPQSGNSDIGAFGSGQNWFVRTDGGTRFSSNVPTGQCDGLHDAAYPGSGVNQACAYKDFRYIWDDDSGVVGLGTWQPIGGDIVAVRGCTANANQVYPSNPNCRIGWDAGVGTAGVNDWCRGVGNNICTNPTITAGSSAAHTRIMSGWAYDHPGQPVADANKIQLFGGYGLQLGTFNLAGTQWLDLIGIELTTHNQVSSGNLGFPGNCTKGGSPAFPVDCNGGTQPYDDYAQNGFVTSNTSANILFQDVKVHGFNASGFWGPIGGPITMTRVSSNNNGFAGWNFADQSDTPNAAGSSITASFVTMNSNGCYEQYPIVSALPLRACYDSNSGGFGDAWSGQDTLMDTFICDHCTMNYNTKDAFIGPHAQVKNLTVTNSVAIGNMGAQMKYGTQQFATTLFQNNLFVMNCYRQQETLPGAPQNFNQSTGLGGSYLTNFCRAGGDGWAFLTRANSTAHFYGNTIVGANSTMMDINCGFVDTGGVHEETNCGTSPLLWTDNNMIGYTPPENGGQSPGLWFFDPGAGGSLVLTADHNNYFGVRNTSPDVCGVNNITCANPLMVTQPAQPWPGTEAALDVYNANPGSSFTPINTSPLALAGRQLTGLNTDFYGNTRTIPPAIGGVNANGSGPPPPTLTSITVTPNPGSVLVGSTLPMGCTSTFSDSTTAPCTSPTWTTSGAHTTINVTSGVVTGVSAGADTIAAAIGSIHGGAIVNVTAVIVPPKGTVSGHFTITGSCTGVCP